MKPFRFSAIILAFCCAQATLGQQIKKKIESSEQLPTHSYPVSGKASTLLTDEAAFTTLAASLEKDLEADLREYDIQDKATLKSYYSTLMEIAILASRYNDALSFMHKRDALEDKPAAKAMAGLYEQPLIDAMKTGKAQTRRVFEAEYRERVQKLPYEIVQNEVKSTKGGFEIMSANLLTASVQDEYDKLAETTGSIPKSAAMYIVSIRQLQLNILPRKDFVVSQLQALIDAHKIVKKNIWGDRTVTLSGGNELKEVVIGVWDSGVDPKDFVGNMWINEREIPNNQQDDDGNGYVDDVYGIGWDWYGKKNVGPLRTIEITQAQLDTYKQYAKGMQDMAANLDTTASIEVKKKVSTLPKDEVKAFFEGEELYMLYAHGTHVAGIALAGNPSARILVIRNDWSPLTIKPPPNQVWADGWAAMLRDSVRYLRENGARAVNMSWTISPGEIEGDMQGSGSGGTVEERHATAGRYFKMLKDSFVEAIQGAGDVLFIACAGNSDNDGRFDQFIPAAVDLPNTMTVGAVDIAGDEAPFTSYGKVDLYANGYEVDSVVPGGDHQSWSGSSMAAPQVTNLAGKLLAKYPNLTAVQVKKLIVDGADEKEITGRKVRLLNQKRTFELAEKMGIVK